MAKDFDDAQSISRYVHDLVRRRAMRAIAKHDERLSKSYEKIAEGIRKDLRAAGFTVAQVRDILEKHIGATTEARVAVVEEAIRDAAREARTLDKETFDALFGAEEVAQAPRPLGPSSKRRPKR